MSFKLTITYESEGPKFQPGIKTPKLTCSEEDADWVLALTEVVAPTEHTVAITLLEDSVNSKIFSYDASKNTVTIKPKYKQLIVAGEFCI